MFMILYMIDVTGFFACLAALSRQGRAVPLRFKALPGIPDALSKGTINGCVIPWEVVPSVKVHELTKFHAEFDPAGGCLYTTTFVMAMNKAKYDSLPPDLQKVIDKNSGRELSAWLGKTMADDDIPGKEKIIAAKNTVSVIPAAETASAKVSPK